MMKTNKLTIEEQFLTIEQAKELKEIGIDFSGANFGIYNFYDSLPECEVTEIRKLCKPLQEKLVTETLSVVEILEMLPKEIEDKSIIVRAYEDRWVVEYKNHLFIPVFSKSLLRDALFEMIKWLKTNKLI